MRFEPVVVVHRLLPLICATAFVGACASDPATEDGGETTAASGTAGETATGDSTTTTTDTTDTTDTATTGDDASFIADTGPDTGMDTGAPGNLGDMCQTDADCAEDLFCNGIPGFGGICSECGSDADCDGGNCTISANGWFECGDGSLGQMCETDMACAGDLHCADLIDLGGLFPTSFCSECADDSHCAMGQLCAPQVDLMNIMGLSGQRVCIDPGTLGQDSLCDHTGSGDEQCEGFCTSADIMGIFEIGLCGECETDGDCMGNATCMPAVIDLMSGGFSGSLCG